MFVKNLTVERFGRIDHRSFSFGAPLTIFAGEETEEIFAALCAALDNRLLRLQTTQYCFTEHGRFSAEIEKDGKLYTAEAVYDESVPDHCAVRIFSGRRRLSDEVADADQVGACTGLAWTSVGGTTLTIEVSAMPGKGEILLTGKLGDVMKESARAAISYIRAHADDYGIPPEAFHETDIHIHVPEGATPKDGPSAGITMATAILSAFTHKPVRKDIAMTGEITLRGKVLPIGGLKEKALAAHRAGIRNVIIPRENEKDEEEIPENVRKDITFIPAAEADTVFVSCTGLGIIDAIPMMEQDFERPVITSNQATWWATLRELGIKDDLGLGRLFQL